jgi:uncharacterized protein (TIGR02391 family)
MRQKYKTGNNGKECASMGNDSKDICFAQAQMQAIADALGHTSEGLTGSEIEHLLATSKIKDVNPDLTKRIRLYNAFATSQNKHHHRKHILAFIRFAMKPERFSRYPSRFEPMRANLNQALLFAGLMVKDTGELKTAARAATLSDAHRRAQELRADLVTRGVHPDVLTFCKEELLADNYFHAVLEAVKSVMQKLREKTGLTDDGGTLIDRALTGDPPMLAINALKSESEKSEQRGFANLVRGTFGMFRNTTAHAPRVHWAITKEDAEDLLSLVSLIHRRLDSAYMPPRV